MKFVLLTSHILYKNLSLLNMFCQYAYMIQTIKTI